MRTYLQAKVIGTSTPPQLDLVFKCGGCNIQTPLNQMYGKGDAVPMLTPSINTLRLAEFIGRFAMEHSGCPDSPIG